MSIIAEVPGFFQLLSNGSVKRFAPPQISTKSPPEFAGGYQSKDITIDACKPISARIFLPQTQHTTTSSPLPVLVYFHGGGFCFGSTTWSGFHSFLGGLCVRSQAIILSVDYRLAPEHRLPTAYDDCYCSIQWLSSNASVEPWLERADLSRVFLSGESAGGNIVHNVMLALMQHKIRGISLKGSMIIHPFFGSEQRTDRELAAGVGQGLEMCDLFWRLSLPEGSDRDHSACNFEKKDQSEIDGPQFPAVVVFVAELDLLKERGIMYAEFLRMKGAEVKVIMAEGQQHAYHVFHPTSEATHLLQNQMVEFINHH